MKKIYYKDVLELGFIRKDLNDDIFFNQYGFGWFIVTFKINKNLYLDWDCNTHEVTLIRNNKGDIMNKIIIEDLETLKKIISFYNEKNTKKESVLKITENQIMF